MGSIFEKVYKDGHTMQSIKEAVVAMANETVIEQMSARQQEIMRNVGALPKLASEVKDLRRQLERSERKGHHNPQSRRQSRVSCRSESDPPTPLLKATLSSITFQCSVSFSLLE